MRRRSRFALVLPLLPLCVPWACGSHKHVAAAPPTDTADAAASSASPPPPPPPSLYARLGKREGLTAVANELAGNLVADKRFGKLFSKMAKDKDRAAHFEASLVEELCVVAEGDDCNYQGKPMKEAHQGMNITEAQWTAFVGDLDDVLKLHDVDPALVKELDDKLEGLKADIVSTPAGKTEKGK